MKAVRDLPENKEAKATQDRKYNAQRLRYYYEHRDHLLSLQRKRRSGPGKHKHREYQRDYRKKKYTNNCCFKLRTILSVSIGRALRRRGGSKRSSILSALPYSMDELIGHLESQFEPWMNWSNMGRYSKAWDDNDPSTWTWQIDHIVPASTFKYKSMQDKTFKKCWSLLNLRPLSAKKNLIDGTNRSRHRA